MEPTSEMHEVNPENVAKGLFPQLAKNLGLISALFSLMSALVTMIFIFGYLSIFDSTLIVLLQYSDVINFSLIGIFIIFPFALSSFFFRKIHLVVKLAIILIPFALFLIMMRYDFPIPAPVALAFTLVSNTMFTHGYFINMYTAYTEKQIGVLITSVLTVAVVVFCVGYGYGAYIDVAGMRHKFIIDNEKEGDRVISDALIVLFTSHHVVIKRRLDIYVFPTDRVREIAFNILVIPEFDKPSERLGGSRSNAF